MTTIQWVETSILYCLIYLVLLVRQRRYRLLVPCTIHTLTWLFVSCLIYFTLTGDLGRAHQYHTGEFWEYDEVAPFIFGLIVASSVGFTLAHFLSGKHKSARFAVRPSSLDRIDYVLKRFHWILYVCLALGTLQAIFLYMAIGFDNLGDYRYAAVTLKRTGFGAFAQQFSGHATILGSFYLALLGYRQAYSGIDFKRFFLDAFLLASTNIAIAGRTWILTVVITFTVPYLWQQNALRKRILNRDFGIVVAIVVSMVTLFSVIGVARNNLRGEDENVFFDRFLYYTDGSRVMNLTLSQFPDGSFEREMGKCEFLSKWIPSKMEKKFLNMKSEDPGMEVTVPSAMPFLYFDFGYVGSFFAWAFICFAVEVCAQRLRSKHTVMGILAFCEFSKFFFQAPVGNIFAFEVPIIEWLLILYLLRGVLHLGIEPAKNNARNTGVAAFLLSPFMHKRYHR